MIWQVANAVYGSVGFHHYQENGWEPFAVTGQGVDTIVWFRKRKLPCLL